MRVTDPQKKLLWRSAIFLITITAVFLRWRLLLSMGSLWGDEAFTTHFAAIPLKLGLAYLSYDTHPPLHYLLVHFWFLIFGSSDIALRALSIVWSALWIPLIIALGHLFFNRTVALVAGLFSALSPLMIYYGVDGRMYGLLILLSTVSMFFFWKWAGAEESPTIPPSSKIATSKNRSFFWWLFFSSALVLTHSTGAAAVAAQAIFLFVRHFKNLRQLFSVRRMIFGFLIVATIFLLWFIPTAQKRYANSSASQEWQFSSEGDTIWNISQSILWLPAGELESAVGIIVALAFLLAAFSRVRAAPVQLILIWTLAVLIPFSFVPHIVPRFIMAAAPAIILLAAFGLTSLVERVRQKKIAAVIITAGMLMVFYLMSSGVVVMFGERLYNWDRAAAWIMAREKTDDLLVHGWFGNQIPLGRYLRGERKITSFYPFKDHLSLEDAYVRHISQLTIKESALDEFLNLAGENRRIFFMPGMHLVIEGDGETLFGTKSIARQLEWWTERGWKVMDEFPFDGKTAPVWLLER
ncbi:MAG: putative rane protein, partial [Candidatus Magasanikbacteria bacterium]|nr:putative rane protein [Candidatus Magasanikbacteria bacterium]